MTEVDLLKKYPKPRRQLDKRAQTKTKAIKEIAGQFGKEYFDGDRAYGYGGYSYNPQFWQPVVPDFKKYYKLSSASSILDVGCAKGFMLYDFTKLIPGITVAGIDIAPYAIASAHPGVKAFLQVGNAKRLPFKDKSFDLVISINTIHNLALDECKEALREISRVSKKDAFITVDAYRTKEEKKRMEAWNLTALTYMHTKDWVKLFDEVGYHGDYYWFIP